MGFANREIFFILNLVIKKFISNGWWVIGLDHEASNNIVSIINKINTNDKVIFVLGSEGKGIRRLIKENCNFLGKIPNIPNTHSINVSNAAAIENILKVDPISYKFIVAEFV